MANKSDTIIIKKYANRRLYNTGTSTYVTLEDLATMVKNNDEFTVQDAKSGEDLTHAVLTQIIFEQEAKTGQTMLPVSVLRQLISFYGDQMQMVVPSYLEHSMAAFAKEQSQLRDSMASMVGKSPMDMMASSQEMIQEQTRRNMVLFQDAMSVFNPFAPVAADGTDGTDGAKQNTPAPQKPASESEATSNDLDQMRDQIAEMQRKLEGLGK